VQIHHKYWANRLPESLWAHRKTWRNTTRFTPYELVYGKNVVLLIGFQIQTLRIAVQVGLNLLEAQKHHLEKINKLDEIRQVSLQQTFLI
jgi:hypothetical protein